MMNNSIGRYPSPARATYPAYFQQPSPAISKIRDYLLWSIINLFFGGLIFGLIAVLFSYYTRESKRENKLQEALKWSRRALIWNIIVTVLGVLVIIALVIGLAVGLSSNGSSGGVAIRA